MSKNKRAAAEKKTARDIFMVARIKWKARKGAASVEDCYKNIIRPSGIKPRPKKIFCKSMIEEV
jgi:hypothetical protein